MKKILLGRDAAGRPLYLEPELRMQTHMHIVGGTRTGKSKLLEIIARQDIHEGHGFCVLDWHGTLYNDLVRWCGWHDLGLDGDARQMILLNPSRPDFVTAFNPFMDSRNDLNFVSTLVSRYIDATLRPWGVTNTDQTPSLERNLRALFHFAVESGEPLPNMAKLLEFERRDLRNYAIDIIHDPHIQNLYRELQSIKSAREWREWMLSTENRLTRFLASKGVLRFLGLPQTIDLMEAMEKSKIVLVNLGYSDFLHRPEARVFASLFLYQFFDAAMRRANRSPTGERPRLFTLILDEFQEYVTDDLAGMLDQVLKGGLHVCMAHQHLGQFEGNRWLEESVLTNARIRVVFGGQTYESACKLANELFLPDLNTRQIKKAYWHLTHIYREETRAASSRSHGRGWSTSTSHTEGEGSSQGQSHGRGSASSFSSMTSKGSGINVGTSTGAPITFPDGPPEDGVEGWFTQSEGSSEFSARASGQASSESEFSSESHSDSQFSSESETIGESTFDSEGETTFPVWVPIPMKELASETEWSREEKLSKIAEMLKHQPQRHAFVKLDLEKTQPLIVPWVRDHPTSEESIRQYEREVFKAQGALPGPEVDRLIAENSERFLAQARQHLSKGNREEELVIGSKEGDDEFFES